ncbi:TldD/PmbA family protein [Sphingomonas japonica]|uniref:PmbA protein n=1 Tax=Sphingomonas japonica TaxID=511662 RepID=A0ABX0U1J6_9SPHN|nr:metallopeptidase TldD-related protein [Sphingomonas japonica]NIJ22593.1 PmbA protein [Sphingomonas japonica]
MLSKDEALSRANAAIAAARSAGADAADVAIVADRSTDVSVRLGELEDVSSSEGVDVALRVFCGQRSASISSSELAPASFAALAERAVAMAREAPEDPWAGLAPADRLLHGAPPELDLDDRGSASPEQLRDRAAVAENAARAVAGVTNSEGGSASASATVVALATSHGFAAAYRTSGYSVSASVLAGEEGRMQRDSAYHSVRHQAMLDDAGTIGRQAGERAVAKRDPVKVASGAMPIVFDPRVANSLVAHLLGAVAGPGIARKTSFLREHLGHRILPPGVAVLDDPHRPHGLRSRPFDGEGLPVSPTAIVEDGVLKTWLLDSASARQLGLEPTGHAARGGGVSASNVHLAGGHVPPGTLIEDIATGIYVTGLIGSGVNGTTGDYSRGATGFLIENGAITRPVAEITVAGNLIEMFAGMTPANDLEFRYGINAPTLRIDGMTVAGD